MTVIRASRIMTSVAAILGRSVSDRLKEDQGVLSHGVRPSSLLIFLNGITSMLMLIDMTMMQGVALRPMLREWLSEVADDLTQLAGAISALDRELLGHYRDDESDAAAYDMQFITLVTELTGWSRDVSSMLAVAHPHSQDQMRRLLAHLCACFDSGTDGFLQDDFTNRVRKTLEEIWPTAQALKDAALPLLFED